MRQHPTLEAGHCVKHACSTLRQSSNPVCGTGKSQGELGLIRFPTTPATGNLLDFTLLTLALSILPTHRVTSAAMAVLDLARSTSPISLFNHYYWHIHTDGLDNLLPVPRLPMRMVNAA